MKKLLFIILTLLFTNELFADVKCIHYKSNKTLEQGSNCNDRVNRLGYTWVNYPEQWSCVLIKSDYSVKYVSDDSACNVLKKQSSYIDPTDKIGSICNINPDTGVLTCSKNPQENGNNRCDESYIKDGNFYNCNPDTNQEQFVENSDGYEEDEDGDPIPKCKSGYSLHNLPHLHSWGTRNVMHCLKDSNDSPDDYVGQTPKDTTSSTGSYYTGSDGSVSWTGTNGNNYNYDPKTNVLIETNFSTGTAGAHTVPNGWQPGQSFTPNGQGYSGGGSGGSSGSGNGSDNGDTGNGETGGTGSGTGTGGTGNTGTDEQIDDKPVANSCNDSSMTLQEKMLCEMNQGIKKLNSESAPSNSLNQLMKDLNNKSTQTNDSLDVLKNNTNVTNQNLQSTNTKLDSLNTATNTTNTKLDNLNSTLGNLDKTLKDIEKNTKSTSTSLGGSTSIVVGGSSSTGSETGGEGEGNEISINDINSITNNNESLFDNIVSIYTTFSDNVQYSFSQISTQIENTQNLIQEPANIFNSSTVISCPVIYSLNFSDYSLLNKNIEIDFCKYTSTLRPYIYFFIYVSLMFGLLFLVFRVIGFLL